MSLYAIASLLPDSRNTVRFHTPKHAMTFLHMLANFRAYRYNYVRHRSRRNIQKASAVKCGIEIENE